ncbi:MAG: hypothetical protein ACYCO9_16375 [Streptosporangiaceae bacterium]
MADDETQDAPERRSRFGETRDRAHRISGRLESGVQHTRRGYQRGTAVPRWVAAGRSSYGAKHLLTAELLAGIGLVAIRAVADYQPNADGTLKGKIGHPQGEYGPLPTLAGLLVTFFLLSFLAAQGGTRAKVAVLFGALVDLVLAMKSASEFDKVANTFSTFGKAKTPPGKWQTKGAQAGSPLHGGVSFKTSASASNGQITKPGKNHKCPPGHHYDKAVNRCLPDINPHIYT